ncbi:FkbM family methyltransferase [Roseixanthobacter glucoisosaccharinicivorans]|uniref:FkbM family methyltransferase n=1 Tax=Roseixanthobacter glucoisosaccharinicivorans TaxID=3119923 RepID=UPI00372664DE
MLRDIVRNLVLEYLPPSISYSINIWKNVRLGYLEPEMPVVERVLGLLKARRGGLFAVDVGANLGLFSYILAKSGAQVLAIEPQPKLFAYLQKVVGRGVEVRQFALSDSEGTAKLAVPRMMSLRGAASQQDALATIEDSNPISKRSDLDLIEVPITSLDRLLSDRQQVDFIKIDVEGHEFSVLRGGLNVIKTFHPVFMIEIVGRHSANASRCGDILFLHGYVAVILVFKKFIVLETNEAFRAVLDQPLVEGVDISNFFFFQSRDRDIIKSLSD